jgi:hypothetical protein
VYSRRIFWTKDEWLRVGGKVLMTWNIFNPNGPTVNTLGLANTTEPTVKNVFWRWLHFTTEQAFSFGTVDTQLPQWWEELEFRLLQRFGAAEVVPPGISMLTCPPSIVTVVPGLSNAARLFQQSQVMLQGSDLPVHMYRHAKYGADLFERTTEELWGSEAAEKRHGKRPEPKLPPLDDRLALARYWYESVTDPAFVEPAAVKFAIAWVGATNQATDSDDDPLVKYRYEDVDEFLTGFEHPLLTLPMTNAQIAERFGVSRERLRRPRS